VPSFLSVSPTIASLIWSPLVLGSSGIDASSGFRGSTVVVMSAVSFVFFMYL